MSRARALDRAFQVLGVALLSLALGALGFLLWDVARDGLGRLSWSFLAGYPSRRAANAGLLPALAGSLWLMVLTAVMAVPVGVGAAIALEEYGGRGRWARLLEINIANLAGVPSIVYGLLGLGLFVRALHWDRSLLAGAGTLALLVLPMVILTAREALRAVPVAQREASLALGATKWQTIRHQVLPTALPGMLTGLILAMSRAIGETAPLVVIGALTYVPFVPDGPLSPFTALPLQIFAWVSRPQQGFRANAAAAILVLLAALLLINSLAIWARDRAARRRAA
jgi:phosphate transport system permease protein